MIVRFLDPVKNFPGVRYNTNKVERNKGELMKVSNFGALQGLADLRPQDYINYLQMLSAQNRKVKKPQLHVVLSGKGKLYDKFQLTQAAELWMKEMGYGEQPYFITLHRDTGNDHVHIVSTRIDRQGEKIDSAFEWVRGQKALNKVLGYDHAFTYKFSTKAQFYLLLEQGGFLGRDLLDHSKLEKHIGRYRKDQQRAGELRDLFLSRKAESGFLELLATKFHVELVFHASAGKQPYGYTVLDHHTKQVFKGGEILPLKHLLDVPIFPVMPVPGDTHDTGEQQDRIEVMDTGNYIGPVWIADDIDDEGVLGRNRQRKRKARTNTR